MLLYVRFRRYKFRSCYSTLGPPTFKHYNPGPPMSSIKSFGGKNCETDEYSLMHGKGLKGASAAGKDKKTQKLLYSKPGITGSMKRK
mmetsp:Transcript_30863/g.99196  ORF Transcript_30863/g.99196 Transcript_30863/m.99196 type:complete len:87 (+) Transcript_30863:234-494(+)